MAHIDRKIQKTYGTNEEKLNFRCVEFKVMTILVGFYRNKPVLGERSQSEAS